VNQGCGGSHEPPQWFPARRKAVAVLQRIGRIAETFSGWLLVAISVIVALQVLFRYVLHVIAPWTEEMARYISIWMVYSGTIVATVRKDHIKVSVLVNRFPQGPRLASEILAVVVGTFVSIIVFVGSIRLILHNWRQLAVTFPVSVAVLYVPLTLFALLSIVALCARVIEMGKGKL
jgi:TRAP-type C4-dicarboxylate transport system permease small subunit